MKYDKSLQEVWQWKTQLNEELNSLTNEEILKKIKSNSERIEKKYNLKLKKISLTTH